MPSKLQLAGKVFGKLTVLCQEGKSQNGKMLWRCRCECGSESLMIGSNLMSGNTTQCFECGRRAVGEAKSTHGHKRGGIVSRAYVAWQNMRLRCNPHVKHKQWQKDYIARGITYPSEWDSFERFLADMGEPREGDSLDRIDNSQPYSKANCRWTDRTTQRRNSRGVRLVTVKGEQLILAEAVAKYSTVAYGIVASRLHRGWPIERAILAPKSHRWSRKKVS